MAHARPVPGEVRRAAANVTAVRNFVTRDGLQLYNTQGLGDLTFASGTAAQVEQTFGVTIHNFVKSDGTSFYANANAPLVPSGVGVVGVLGLQNLLQLNNPKAKPGPGNPEPQGQASRPRTPAPDCSARRRRRVASHLPRRRPRDARFAATGDTGAGCAVGATAVNGVTYGPVPDGAYPASDPNATGVGGTVLYTNGAATNPVRVDEHAWDHGGGTKSSFIAQPAYQNGIAPLKANLCISQPDGQPYVPTGDALPRDGRRRRALR